MKDFSSSFRLTSALLVGALIAPVVAAQAPHIVGIPAANGIILKGTLFVAPRPGPAVLLLHQCDEQRKVWDALGTRLAAAGVTALSFDYRGYGESGGTPYTSLARPDFIKMTNEQWPSDIDTAFAFLSRLPGVDPTRMAVAGGSCGVDNAVHLAQRHKNVRALALLAGGADRTSRAFISRAGAPPIFTAAAADDRYADFVAIMGWITALSKSPLSRMAQYTDGGHAAIIFGKHPGLADTLASWFSIVLKARSGTIPTTNGTSLKADIVRTLAEINQRGGAESVTKRLIAARSRQPHAQLFPEYFANQLGYEHLAANDLPGALAIMKLIVEAYPASPNAMDSLGDIYLAMGDKAAALRAAKRTLELLEKDTTDTEARKQAIREAAQGKIKELSGS